MWADVNDVVGSGRSRASRIAPRSTDGLGHGSRWRCQTGAAARPRAGQRPTPGRLRCGPRAFMTFGQCCFFSELQIEWTSRLPPQLNPQKKIAPSARSQPRPSSLAGGLEGDLMLSDPLLLCHKTHLRFSKRCLTMPLRQLSCIISAPRASLMPPARRRREIWSNVVDFIKKIIILAMISDLT